MTERFIKCFYVIRKIRDIRYKVQWVGSLPGGSVVKNLPANARDTGDAGSIPGSRRFPWGGNGNPLQYSCLDNPVDRWAWQGAIHGVAKELDTTERLSTHAQWVGVTETDKRLQVYHRIKRVIPKFKSCHVNTGVSNPGKPECTLMYLTKVKIILYKTTLNVFSLP